jgi:hypothetical protein
MTRGSLDPESNHHSGSSDERLSLSGRVSFPPFEREDDSERLSLKTLAISSGCEKIARAEGKSCTVVETWPGDREGYDKCRRPAIPSGKNSQHVREGG